MIFLLKKNDVRSNEIDFQSAAIKKAKPPREHLASPCQYLSGSLRKNFVICAPNSQLANACLPVKRFWMSGRP
jgi:hypothetical protein